VVGFERRLWPWNLLMHLALAIIFGASQIFLDTLGYRLSFTLLFTEITETQQLWQNYVYFLKTMGHTAIIIYFMIALGSYALTYFRQFRDAEVDRARVRTQLAEAHLESLKSRLHPHFLFNALNSISALLHTDVERADRMIARLSELLRVSIENTGVREVRLSDEIDFLNRYLDIQKVRFEDRLTVAYNTTDEVAGAAVPSLILQPLVENTIRHGVSKVIRPVTVQVEAYKENGNLVISVQDNGPGFDRPVDEVEPGFGLRSTRERLIQMYGNNQSFELQSTPGEGVGIRIRLPYRPFESGAADRSGIHEENN
jgi:LytS/YehU family sensor histidine kinase